MFCPVCRYEYLEGTTQCNDCGVPLVEELAPEKPKEKSPPMRLLKPATLSAIIGLSYFFIIRGLNTIFPKMLFNPYVAGVNAVMFLLAQLTMVFFFVCFYREYVQKEQKKLKTAALLVIIAELVMTPLRIITVLSILSGTVIAPIVLRGGAFLFASKITAWVAALCLLFFFIVFHKETASIPSKGFLKKATFLAAAGAGLILLKQTFTPLLYHFQSTSGNGIDFSGMGIYFILIGIPLVIFPVVTFLIFFISFYREQK